MSNIILKLGKYRIIEIRDENYQIEELKGDMYRTEVNPDVDPIRIKREEKEFEEKVECDGVFIYSLERWNPAIGVGWEHVDSCGGFIGDFEEQQHYIVGEMKDNIKEMEGE